MGRNCRQSPNLPIRTRWFSWGLLVLLVCGSVLVHEDISSAASFLMQETNLQGNADSKYQLLLDRVSDNTRFLNITIIIIGVMVTALSLFYGITIKRLKDYGRYMLERRFYDFRQDVIEPCLDEARAQLENVNGELIPILIKSYEVMYDALLRVASDVATGKVAEYSGLGRSGEKAEWFREFKDVSTYLITSLSRDPQVVKDVCQKIFVIACSDVVKGQAGLIVDHLRQVMGTWPYDPTVRAELRSTIEEIQRSQQNVG